MILQACQIEVSEDIERNLQRILDAIDHASGEPTLALLPEYALSGPPALDGERAVDPGRLAELIERVVSRTKTTSTLHLFLPTLEHADRGWYSAVHYIQGGSIIGTHRKTVITEGEGRVLLRGETLSIFDVDGIQVAPLICAEANGAELSSLLSMRGAEVILHPTYPDMPPPVDSSTIDRVDPWSLPLYDIMAIRARTRAFTEQYYHVTTLPAELGYRSFIVAPDSQVVARAASGEPTVLRTEMERARYVLRESEFFEQRRRVFEAVTVKQP